MTTAGLLFMLKTSIIYSRVVVGGFFLTMLVSAWMLRLIKRGILAYLTSRKILTKNVLIIGAGKIGLNVFEKLSNTRSHGYNVVGFLDDNKEGPNIIGSLSEIELVINRCEVDEIIVTIPSERNYVYNILRNIQRYKINVKIIPELFNLVTTKIGHVESLPFVEVGHVSVKGLRGFMKRTVDLALASIGILILLPLLLVLWIAVKMSSPGPAVFKQVRIGKDGRRFYIYKFRSMVLDAEKRLRENPELYKKYIESNYKLEPDQDPRITRIGRFLRRTSLDELPQLFNVLKGEMSLVGPRPVVEEELQEYDQLIFDFLSVKPGITGYWQVSGRSDAGYPERVDIELYYVYNQSLTLDLQIMFKTVSAVLNRKGAY
jgi:exopolysaccharide biosynthesis polyprenyl glycosylphosphotransferase